MPKRAKSPGISTPSFEMSEEHPSEMLSIDIKEELLDEDQNPELVLSNKGGPKLIHKGYMYTMHKRQPSSIRWRCVLRTYQCRGSLITNLECKRPYERMNHSHEPDYAAAESARQKYKAFGQPFSAVCAAGQLHASQPIRQNCPAVTYGFQELGAEDPPVDSKFRIT